VSLARQRKPTVGAKVGWGRHGNHARGRATVRIARGGVGGRRSVGRRGGGAACMQQVAATRLGSGGVGRGGPVVDRRS
jgi:hypothetical protein